MSRSFLESTLGGACPSFMEEWTRLRGTFPPERPPAAPDLLGALRVHVLRLLAEGRVAEVARLFLTVERMLGEADPILRELLEDGFLVPLASDCRQGGLDPRRIRPHLGPRVRAVWDRPESPTAET